MRPFLLSAVLLMSATPLLAQSQALSQIQSADISGSYDISGLNADGSRYQGRLVLHGSGIDIDANWTVADKTYSGKGTLEGRILTLTYGDPTPAIYVLMPNGALHGTWDDGQALERATPQN